MRCGADPKPNMARPDADARWIRRAIPTDNAVRTAVRTADDGHEIRADLFGMGTTLGEPCTLIVTCEPFTVETSPDTFETFERLPSIMELIEAADELAAGIVLSLQFFGNPEGVPRIPIPPGAVRSFTCTEIGRLKGSKILVVA